MFINNNQENGNLNLRTFFVIITLLSVINVSGTIKVSCVGNSITEGNMGGKYPVYLSALLGDQYQVENHGVSGTTLLKNGDKSYWKKGKLDKVFEFQPDIITIKLGTNDTKSQNWNTYKDEFKPDLQKLIDTLSSMTSKPDIFLVLPVPIFSDAYGIQAGNLSPIIMIIKEVAETNKLPVIDVNTPMQNSGDYFPDGVHPNKAGADTIAHVIYRALIAPTNAYTDQNCTTEPAAKKHQRFKATVFNPGKAHLSKELFDISGRIMYKDSKVNLKQQTNSGIYFIEY